MNEKRSYIIPPEPQWLSFQPGSGLGFSFNGIISGKFMVSDRIGDHVIVAWWGGDAVWEVMAGHVKDKMEWTKP